MGLFSFYNKHKSADQAAGSDAAASRRAASTESARASNAQNSDLHSGLPEKKRARRRLVGAVVLALAAAVGLPMILDSEPKPLADDISIEIPSKQQDAAATPSSGAASASSTVAAVTPPAASAVGKSLADPAADPSLSPSEQIVDVPPSPSPSAAMKPGPARIAEVVPKPDSLVRAPKPDKMQAAVHEEMNQNRHGDVQHDADRHLDAKAPLDDASVAKTPVKVHPKPPDDIKPVALDADASRALDILEGKPAAKVHSSKKYVLQVAALSSQDKIDELQNKLKSAGLHSYTEKVTSSGGERTRIRLGPFGSKEELDQARARLNEIGLNGSTVPAP